MNKKNFGYLLLIIGLVGINEVFFRWIGHISYIEWFIKNGSQIGLVGALVTLVWDINKHTGLISAKPSQYVGSYFQLLGMTYISLGRQMVSKDRQDNKRISLFDILMAVIINFILAVLYFIWMLIIAPLQYFIILVLGVPARVFLKSDVKLIAKFDDTDLKYEELPKEKEVPKGWMDVSYSNKPVTFTNALITLAFAIIKIFWT